MRYPLNEQRQQAYLNLIRSLLDFPSGEESEILAANQELLDAGFVQKVEAVAQMYSQHGDENTANWLQSLAMQLREELNLDNQVDLQSFSEEERQAYLQFLMDILRATEESDGDSQIVYSLLEKNMDKLDGLFVEILRHWGANTLRKAEVDDREYQAELIGLFSTLIAQFSSGNKANNIEIAITGYEVALTFYTHQASEVWAEMQYNLAYAYSKRIRGDIAKNLEQAIAAYHDALKVFTFDTFPQNWATTQNGLAIAYCERIRGDAAENLEQAIACYQEALKVRTFEASPYEWGETQNNLATAYNDRIRGNMAENLEQAMACYQDTLKAYTFNAFPYEWARTQYNLATAYCDRIRGERAENLERAIVASQDALKVFTFAAFRYEWAMAQNNLASAYINRIRGERSENLERAITCYQEALKVYIFKAFPQDWATTQNGLAITYCQRIRGERSENLERAITCYQEALKVYTFKAFPRDWAMTQNGLAIAYCERIRGDAAENLEQAIACYQEALKVYTFKALPQDWAMTQNNLAIAYRERIKGDKADNIEKAIAAYTDALTVRTKEDFPQDWAMTQSNLANAYSNRIEGNKADNIEKAIAAFTAALTVRTKEALPQDHAEILFGLGRTYQDANKFNLAYNTFESAIVTVETLREEIVSGEESKRKQAESFNKVYRRMVEVCRELNKITEAIEYVERSKTRYLVEQILIRDSKTIFPPEVFTQLEKYRDEIATGQYQIQNGKAENPKVLAQHLQELRQQRNELQNQYLPIGYGFKFDSFQASLDEHTAIIEWYILNDKILAFIATKRGELSVWQSQPEDREALRNWRNEYLQNYYIQKDQWLNNLGKALKELASILHIDEILTQIPKHCDKLILIPHQVLHLFPLHAIPVNQNSENSSCLLDLFAGGVSYAPSCQLLQQVQQRKRPDFQSLFAIQNPTEDLDSTNLEVESILSYFPSHQILSKKQATKAALSQAATQLKQANYLHFSCHGSFNLNSPQDSCLLLAESIDGNNNLDLSKCLTLGNLFERTFDFSQTRLVVLSACETGFTDFNNTSDEYIGLPSGFLYAGSSSVVSSLWTVNDLSTSFLMIKFIQILRYATDMSVPLAINQAQLWLRDASVQDLVEWSKKSESNQNLQKKVQELLETYNLEEKLFSSPYYWAAFCAIGQ